MSEMIESVNKFSSLVIKMTHENKVVLDQIEEIVKYTGAGELMLSFKLDSGFVFKFGIMTEEEYEKEEDNEDEMED